MAKKGDDLKVIILNAQSIYAMDSTAVIGLEKIVDSCKNLGIEFYMTEVIGPVRDMFRKTGLFNKIGEDHIKMRIQDALDHFDIQEKSAHSYATQSN